MNYATWLHRCTSLQLRQITWLPLYSGCIFLVIMVTVRFGTDVPVWDVMKADRYIPTNYARIEMECCCPELPYCMYERHCKCRSSICTHLTTASLCLSCMDLWGPAVCSDFIPARALTLAPFLTEQSDPMTRFVPLTVARILLSKHGPDSIDRFGYFLRLFCPTRQDWYWGVSKRRLSDTPFGYLRADWSGQRHTLSHVQNKSFVVLGQQVFLPVD